MKNLFKSITGLFSQSQEETNDDGTGRPNQTANPRSKTTNGTNNNFLAFNLEIARIPPGDFAEWHYARPLGISCAATLRDGEDPVLWYSSAEDGSIASEMTHDDVHNLLDFLVEAQKNGWNILTTDGLEVDFDILAEESGMPYVCAELAMKHTDMMFHFVCKTGHSLGLDEIISGMSLPETLDSTMIAEATELWQQGQTQPMLDFAAQSVRVKLAAAKACLAAGKIIWTNGEGEAQQIDLTGGWLKVIDANNLPLPPISEEETQVSRHELLRWVYDVDPKLIKPAA